MNRLLIGFLVIGALFLTYPLGKKVVDTIRAGGISQVETNENAKEIKVPLIQDLLGRSKPTKASTVKDTLYLESRNTVTFRGPVTTSSVSDLTKRLAKVSRNLSKTDKIYLVLDTPGGSIFDGMDFIDFLEGLPQEVKTVTIFAASMGFQIVENNPGERLIVRNGVLMSHRAKGGIEGQFNGELETRYRMVKRKIDYLDTVDANRVGITFDEYQAKIKDEWWIHGFDSVEEKVADREVLLQCGPSMEGVEVVSVATMFGSVEVTFEKCPLLKEPVSVNLSAVRQDAQEYIKSIIDELFNDRIKFTKEIILTNKFLNIFK